MSEYLKQLKARASVKLTTPIKPDQERVAKKRTTKRSSNMPCLLCEINPATKTESHILSKFIGKKIFGTKGKGYNLPSDKMDKKPVIVQDTPKEDYILCPDCEKYFEHLETYFGSEINNKLWDSNKQQSFKSTKLDAGSQLLECVNADTVLLTLFLHSNIWRMFVTSEELFRNMKAKRSTIEGLRKCLLNYKAVTMQDLKSNATTVGMGNLFPCKYNLHTCEIFKDDTSNVISAVPTADPYYLFLNRYILIISFAENDHQNSLKLGGNVVPSPDPVKIVRFTEQMWEQFRQSFINAVTENIKLKLKSQGKVMVDLEAFLKQQKII